MIHSLYEDGDILVIDKPAGLPAQPGEGVGSTVASAVERDYGFSPYLVHRLDKETAGCMILAKSKAAASRWAALIQNKDLRKLYAAVCSGSPGSDQGLYADPLPWGGSLQDAATKYRLLGKFGASEPWPRGFSFVGFELLTGRTHQIRRHCALHGHPILGDDKYGDFGLNRALKRSLGLRNLLLWSRSLVLPGGRLIRSAPPPQLAAFLGHFPGAPDPEVD